MYVGTFTYFSLSYLDYPGLFCLFQFNILVYNPLLTEAPLLLWIPLAVNAAVVPLTVVDDTGTPITSQVQCTYFLYAIKCLASAPCVASAHPLKKVEYTKDFSFYMHMFLLLQ